jgi:hypothetical protein
MRISRDPNMHWRLPFETALRTLAGRGCERIPLCQPAHKHIGKSSTRLEV